MLQKTIVFTLIAALFVGSGSIFAYTMTDVETANFLAQRWLIANRQATPDDYHLESIASRVNVMALALSVGDITKNANCRGDFADANTLYQQDNITCRIVETAADHWLINPQSDLPKSMRKTRPNGRATRSEALGILMRVFPDTGAWAWYSYYWSSNFPHEGDSTGYRDAYFFWAPWQSAIFYEYIRKVVGDDTAMHTDPRVNSYVKIKEVFEFTKNIIENRS